MKIIDEKGRLFGKVNVIDFSVVLFLLCLMPIFYYGYKVFPKKATIIDEQLETEERMIDIYVVLKDLDEDTVKLVSVGDKDINEAGETEAEILLLGKIDSSTISINLGGGVNITGQDSLKKQIYTKMRIRCQIENDNLLYFKGKKLEFDSIFTFETDKYKAVGYLVDIFETVPLAPFVKEKWLSLKVKAQGLTPEVSNIIKQGDTEKDAFGNIVAKLQSIISNNPSQLFSISQNEVTMLNHPLNRDLSLSIDVLCIEKEGTYYFKNFPVRIGNNIVLSMGLYSISAVIEGMKTK